MHNVAHRLDRFGASLTRLRWSSRLFACPAYFGRWRNFNVKQNKAFLRVIKLNTTRGFLFLVILSNGKPLWSIPCPVLNTLADNDIDMWIPLMTRLRVKWEIARSSKKIKAFKARIVSLAFSIPHEIRFDKTWRSRRPAWLPQTVPDGQLQKKHRSVGVEVEMEVSQSVIN